MIQLQDWKLIKSKSIHSSKVLIGI